MSRTPPFERADLETADAALFSQPRTVRFQEVDAAGTIFFPRVLEFFADAYIGMLEAGGVDLPRGLREGAWVAPLVHAEADFMGPMRFGDRVVVEVVRTRVGATSYSLGYRVRDAAGGKVLALGHTVHVVVGRTSFAPLPVPDEVRRALTPGAGS